VGILGIVVLALMGLELRLRGTTLFIGYLAAAGTLIANPSVNLMPPALASPSEHAQNPSTPAKAGSVRPAGAPRVSLRRRSPAAQSHIAGTR
jgi:hypothetical protein